MKMKNCILCIEYSKKYPNKFLLFFIFVSLQNNTWSPEHALVKYKSIILWWIKFACQRAIVVDFCAFVTILYATPAPPTSITRLPAYLSA